jgi:hypothetical protein
MPPGPPRRRKDYEMRLAHLLNEDLGCFVEHVGKTSGWDLIVAVPFRGKHIFVPIEVKTSIKPAIKLKGASRTKEQLKVYNRIEDTYGIRTVYAYRFISHAREPAREKWRFFYSRTGNLIWTKGKTYKQFIAALKKKGRL